MGEIKPLKLSEHVVFVKKEQSYMAYHSLIGGLCQVDQDVYNLLKSMDGRLEQEELARRYPELEVDDFLQTFYEKGFLVKKDEDDYHLITDKEKIRNHNLAKGNQIKVIQLVVTNECNFRCKYCFTNSIYSSEERLRLQTAKENKMMTPDEAIHYIEKTIEVCDTDTLHIQFFGGEPLVNYKTIEKVLETFKEGQAYGININYSIVTNGYLFNEKVAEVFKRYNVAITISFDSPYKSDRKMLNGDSSLDTIIDNFKLLKAMGNFITINAVLSRETFDYFGEGLIQFAYEHHVSEIGVLFDLNPQFYEEYATEEIIKRLWDFYIEGAKYGIVVTGYWHMIYEQIGMYEYFKNRGFKTCSATGSQLSIEPSGDIFACKGSSGYFGHIDQLEKVLTRETYTHYANRSYRNSPNCKHCELEGFCSGFCLGPLEKKYGDITAIEGEYCQLVKALVNKLICSTENVDRYEWA